MAWLATWTDDQVSFGNALAYGAQEYERKYLGGVQLGTAWWSQLLVDEADRRNRAKLADPAWHTARAADDARWANA